MDITIHWVKQIIFIQLISFINVEQYFYNFNHGNGIDARVQNRHILFAERKWSADTVAAQLLKFLTATRWIYYIVAS